MTRAVAIYLGCALMAALAILRAYDHLTRREPPALPRHLDPEIVVQPWDPRTVTLAAPPGGVRFTVTRADDDDGWTVTRKYDGWTVTRKYDG